MTQSWLSEYFWPVPKLSEYTQYSYWSVKSLYWTFLTVHDPETTSKVGTGACGTSAGGVCGAWHKKSGSRKQCAEASLSGSGAVHVQARSYARARGAAAGGLQDRS
eukprot:scaffold109355_cov75-Phaeocystis_antarctica.AAC.1